MSIFSELGIRVGKDRTNEEFLYNLAACYAHAERRLEQALSRFGLSPVKMNALMILKHAGGKNGLPQVDLARKMIVSAGNITRLIDRLESEGLVERVSRDGDRRVKALKITEKGSELMNRAWPVHQKEINRLASLLRGKDVKAAGLILNDFREQLTHPGEKET